MMETIKKYQKPILWTVAGLVALWLIWFFFFKPATPAPVNTPAVQVNVGTPNSPANPASFGTTTVTTGGLGTGTQAG